MRVSLNWLREYVDLSGHSVDHIARTLTDLGLAVDAIETVSKIPSGVVVGCVQTAIPHPNADSLRLCTVDIGKGEPLQIVCGAPNARAGIFVAVATVGTELAPGFKIKDAKIRGEKSFGMLCSEKELGLSESHDGIIELKTEDRSLLGSVASGLLGAGDTVFTLDLTPNRGDALSHIGVARDLAARLKRPLLMPKIESSAEKASGVSTKDHISVKLSSSEACGRFAALYIKNVSVVDSPAWLKNRVEAAGMRAINLIVDVNNYVMLEFGQPTHAYDERDLEGKRIEVREARGGETLKTLDGQTRTLAAGDILICDGEKPVGLAGIMGGANSGVKNDTRNIIVEVAWFNPQAIRKTVKRLGLRSEASHRFERNTDIQNIPTVARRVGELIIKATRDLIAAGNTELVVPEVATDLVDVYPEPVTPALVGMRLSRMRDLLALSTLKKEQVKELFSAIGLRMVDSTEERMVFEVPSWRRDIEREVDLIEEVARLHGLDKIPYQLPIMSIKPTPEDEFVDFLEDARIGLAMQGLRETVSFPFLSATELAHCQLTENHPLYAKLRLANPLSEDACLMQTTLIPNLLKAAINNRRHGQFGVRLFECGRGYYHWDLKKANLESFPFWIDLAREPRHFSKRARTDANRPIERHFCSGIIDQPFTEKSWNTAAAQGSFFHGKAIAEAWLKSFGMQQSDLEYRPLTNPKDVPFLHPGASAAVYWRGSKNQNFIGFIGEVHPLTAQAYDFQADEAPVVFEFDLEKVFETQTEKLKIDNKMWRFPPVSRDLALVVERTLSHGEFLGFVAKFPRRKYLQRTRLFDVYMGENIPAGKKSVAYSFDFQAEDRTLTDQDVENEITALLQWIGEQTGAEQR